MRVKRIILFVMGLVLFGSSVDAKKSEDKKVKLDLYVMSQCPFGVKAENFIFPAVRSLEKYVDFNLFFIVNESTAAPRFKSLHGQKEVDENILQLCVKEQSPKKYMDFILERNKKISDPDWQKSAKALGIDVEKIVQCSSGTKGAELLSKNLKDQGGRKATGSPTIDIDGKPYSGTRGLKSISLALCAALKAKGLENLSECKAAEALPDDPASADGSCGGGGGSAKAAPPVVFDIQAVVDDACKGCQASFIDTLKSQYPAARIKTINLSSSEGKKLVKDHDAKYIPLYVLGKDVEKTANFNSMKDRFIPSKGIYIARPESAGYYLQLNRPSSPRHLDYFVSPLAAVTPSADQEILRFFRDTKVKNLTFSIHFMVQESAKADGGGASKGSKENLRAASLSELSKVSVGPLVSVDGPEGLKEARRQACLFQHSSMGTFFQYLVCRNQNLSDPALGENCLVMDEAVKTCMDGAESENLLRHGARLARELEISEGPAILWENRYGPFWFESVGSLENLISDK